VWRPRFYFIGFFPQREMGFVDGWGMALDQLVEHMTRQPQ
jgi:hypothetical protein